jgi:hypothetical protein
MRFSQYDLFLIRHHYLLFVIPPQNLMLYLDEIYKAPSTVLSFLVSHYI